jgi:hypothetical protein
VRTILLVDRDLGSDLVTHSVQKVEQPTVRICMDSWAVVKGLSIVHKPGRTKFEIGSRRYCEETYGWIYENGYKM